MNDYLPTNDFKWLTKQQIEKIDWSKMKENSNVGYILEVDLKYPKKLHDLHRDYPLAPEKCKIKNDELGKYQTSILEEMKNFGYRRTPTEKLLLTLRDKKKYVIHYRNLDLYLNLGMDIGKIHRVLSFNQSRWLKPYIKKNTMLRKQSKNDFEKNFFKLMNNSVFGKSCEDKRKHVNIKLALNENQARRWLKKPNFEQFNIIDQEKALIKMRKSSVRLDKPIYIGFTVLELSKYHMYNIHYNVFKKKYKDKIQLCYTDTDSYIYEIQTKDFYKDLKETFSEFMDFSDYPVNHFLHNSKYSKKLGYMKDELNGSIIDEFIGLKSKLYSIKISGNMEKNVAKGLQKAVLKKFVNHKHYRNALDKSTVYYARMRTIRSDQHNIKSIETKKLIHSPFDDKRLILDNGIDSVPYGYKGFLLNI